MDHLDFFSFMKDGPIPTVDPVDLKSVWAMLEELKRDFEKRVPDHASNQSIGIGVDCYERVCSPGADVGAVWYRVSMLGLLQMMGKEAGEPALSGLTDDKPSDAVFRALATLPMTGMNPGVTHDGLPFDPAELVRLIKEAESAT
jgi:hypothetical protein